MIFKDSPSSLRKSTFPVRNFNKVKVKTKVDKSLEISSISGQLII
jgi:hypothetical protein